MLVSITDPDRIAAAAHRLMLWLLVIVTPLPSAVSVVVASTTPADNAVPLMRSPCWSGHDGSLRSLLD
jgi:hypothetical protein